MSKQQNNGKLAVQMEDARFCLADLAQRGAQIESIELGVLPTPRITIARPVRGLKAEVIGIEGGITKRTETWAANHMECHIEWKQPA